MSLDKYGALAISDYRFSLYFIPVFLSLCTDCIDLLPCLLVCADLLHFDCKYTYGRLLLCVVSTCLYRYKSWIATRGQPTSPAHGSREKRSCMRCARNSAWITTLPKPVFETTSTIDVAPDPEYPDELKELSLAVQTIPVTSADAERGFSSMNVICTPQRNRLSVPRLSNILFASLVGPPLNEFCPLPFVKKWLLNHRAAADNQSKKLRYTDTAEMRYGHMMSVFL